MKNYKIKSFLEGSRYIFIVAILFFIFSTQFVSAASKTWDNTSGDGLWNTATNWSTDTVPGGSDTAIFASSNTTNCTINVAVSVGGLQIDSGYSGTVDVGTSTPSFGTFVLNGGTLEATNSSSVTVSSYSQSGTSIFKAPVSLTVNNGSFTYTGGTFTHNNGTVTHDHNISRDFSANGITLYNLVFDKRGSDGNNADSVITGTFTVNDLTVKNRHATYYLKLTKSSTAAITVNGNLDFPVTASAGAVTLGSSNSLYIVSLSLYGNIIMSDSNAALGANVNFIGSAAQTITQTTGTIYGGTWTVNKTNATDTVTLLTNFSGGENITVTQGTFDFGTYTASFASLTLDGGTLEATNSSSITASSYSQSGTSIFKAPASLTVNNGSFTYTAGTFTHNNGTVTHDHNISRTFSANGITLYNLVFDKRGSDGSSADSDIIGTFTVNDLTVKNNHATYSLILKKNGTASITVNGNLNFPVTAAAGTVTLGSTNNLYLVDINLNGHIVMSDSGAILRSNINFIGNAAQTVTQTLGAISGGTWIVNKTNFTDTVTQLTAVSASSGFGMTKGIYDLAGYDFTSGGFTISASSTLRLTGDETINATPTLSAGSIVEYYATTGSRAIKNWTYTGSTLKINGEGGTFTLPANSTISTTTLSAGTLSLNGYNFTSTRLQNNGILRLRGNETITISTSTRSGTIEYVGDGDVALDNYNVTNISNLNYNNLSIISADSVDTYTLPASLNLSGHFTRAGGVVDGTGTSLVLSGSNQIITLSSSTTFQTLSKILTSATDTLTFGTTSSLVITGETVLQGTASYPLLLRSSTPDTQWLIDPQSTRTFSYLDVQDSWNINAAEINSNDITGFVDSLNNTNWGIFPTVISSVATNITATSATLNGEITNTGGENNTIRGFEYGLTTAYGTATSTTGSYGTSTFSAIITGLSPNTTYHYRSYSTNSAGTSSSTDQSFITLVALPTITVASATNITATGATLNGNITNIGGENNTVRGFEYGLTTAYGTATSTTGSYGTSTFSAVITGLNSETSYHYRSFSTNSAGTSSSTDQTFITLDINSPVITITGANPASVNQNAVYTDAGATASDTVDGDLTDDIITINNVDTSIVGNTSVVYTVMDSTGNSATSTRVVTVLDITSPGLSSITATSSVSSVTINWITNEKANSQVQYGLDTNYASTTDISDLSGTTTHSVIIQNLSACTDYHYRVISADLSDNTATSSDASFTTVGCISDTEDTHSSGSGQSSETLPIITPLLISDDISDTIIPFLTSLFSFSEPITPFIPSVDLKPGVFPFPPSKSDTQGPLNSGGLDSKNDGGKTDKLSVLGTNKSFIGNFSSIAGDIFPNFKKITESKTGSVVTKIITTTGVVSGGVVATSIFVANGTVVPDLFSFLFRLWGLLLSAFGLKKRNRPWGTVYDSVTKLPLDPAYIILKKLNSKERVTSITDLDGRYGFLVLPGKYTLAVNKTNYVFPSKKVLGKTADVLYNNLYFGEKINVENNDLIINKNIPLDPVNFDWNEFTKGKKKLTKFNSSREKITRIITDWVFRLGFIFSISSLFLVPTFNNLLIFSLYVILTLLRKFGFRKKALGSLIEVDGNPLSFAIIRVFDSDLNIEIINKVADKIGKYYCLVPKGSYYVKVEKKNDDESYSLIYTSEVFDAKAGIINKNFII